MEEVSGQDDVFRVWEMRNQIGQALQLDGGLMVRFELLTSSIKEFQDGAALDLDNLSRKKVFTVKGFITNMSGSNIQVRSWSFHAICPLDNMGREWDTYSYVPLVMPYVSGLDVLVVKPGETYVIESHETDFYWCFPERKEALLNEPKYITAHIFCAKVEDSKQVESFNEETVEEEINTTKAVSSERPEAKNVKSNQHDQQSKDAEVQYPVVTGKQENVLGGSNSSAFEGEYSKWLFILTDNALQYRFRQINVVEDSADFEVQFRINFEDKIFCDHPDCLGYTLAFGVPNMDRKDYTYQHFKFFNSFKGVYTLPNPIRLQMKFPDGSYRFLTANGFMYSNSTGDRTGASEPFYDCVDQINKNPNVRNRCEPGGGYRNIFIEEKAITIE